MSKVSVIIYIAVALLLIFLISHSPKKPSSNHNDRHRRLKIRSTFSFSDKRPPERVAFDPLVADIERKREDQQWEKMYFEQSHKDLPQEHAPGEESQPEWEDFMNAEDYLNDEDKFNVTDRLILLFPKVDLDPSDGFITEHELVEWIVMNSEKEMLHRSQREMEIHDKNHDGFVSFAEYEPPSWVGNSDNNSFGYNNGWWKGEHFDASDVDGDGRLNLTEFHDFLHPADTKSQKLQHWLCQEEIRERDSDKDGKLNFKEFFHGMFDSVRNYDEGDHSSSHESDGSTDAPARQLFAQLDKDGDGYLSDVELLPVIGKIHPSERYYAKQQADYILSQADTNKDGRLTLTEMIDNPYVFYTAIFNEEDEDDYDYHDEFR